MTKYNVICLIVAAGNGERLKSETPKQYLPLAGMPIIRHSTLTFLNHPEIDAVKIVYNPSHHELYENAIGDLPILSPTAGGKTRQESVYLGLLSIAKYNPKKILIHDAARPLVDARIISDIIHALDKANGAIPALQVDDTIKSFHDGKVVATIPRGNLIRAQTPQGFKYSEILEAHAGQVENNSNNIFSDDSSLFEYLKKEVCIIPGSALNFKITKEIDLKMAEALYDT